MLRTRRPLTLAIITFLFAGVAGRPRTLDRASLGQATANIWLQGSGIALEVDTRSALAVYLAGAGGTWRRLTAPLSQAAPTAAVIIAGQQVSDFVRTGYKLENITGTLGPGKRLTVYAISSAQHLRRTLTWGNPFFRALKLGQGSDNEPGVRSIE